MSVIEILAAAALILLIYNLIILALILTKLKKRITSVLRLIVYIDDILAPVRKLSRQSIPQLAITTWFLINKILRSKKKKG